MVGRRRPIMVLLAVLAGVLGYGGWRLARAWSYKAALVEIRGQMQAGRHALAAKNLAALLDREPDSDEAAYLLGACEKARGRVQAAAEAWERVPPGSPFAGGAILGRAATMVDRGRLAEAEALVAAALADPRIEGDDLPRFLGSLYWQEGRGEDARRAVEAGWQRLEREGRGGSDRAIELARLHIALSVGTASPEGVRGFLDRAAALAPEDDRIRLGKANLAIRQGALDEASRWIDDGLRRRPEDVAIWRARLDWAMAAGRAAEAREALEHLPADDATPARRQRLVAWFAARRDDVSAERRALESLLADEPEDGPALDRLVELAIRAGQTDRAAELRRRKAEVDGLRERYRQLLLRDQPLRDAAEMAGLAEQLGRQFEARAFRAIAASTGGPSPDRREPTAGPGSPGIIADGSRPRGGQTLAQSLAAELGPPAASPASARPAAAPSLSAPVAVRFEDDARAVGLVHVFDNGESPVHQIPEVSSGGVGLLDYDGDGWLDVYAIQGGPFPARGTRPPFGDRLFRNRRDGTFEDVTARSGLARLPGGYGHGVAVGDYDNDGNPDLFLTRWRSYALYRNRGDGTFEDATAAAGLAGDRDWPTSAAFADLDNDGDLDLYVCHYLKWDAENPPLCQNRSRSAYISCDPRGYEPMPDHVFRNDGGRFVDVTAASGCLERDGRGFGVVAVDLDDDNRVDLFVANDQSNNDLFRNLGGFRFEEQGLTAGIACNASGGHQAGMGAAAGDLDGDGRPDLVVTNFFNESTTLFHNLGGGQFVDHTAAIGLAAPSRDRLGFGVGFLDVDDDGRLDLLTANGHVNDYRPEIPYVMPAQLLLGGPGGTLTDVSARAGAPFLVPHIGRGLAVGDLDNDGRLDALLVLDNEPMVYLHNRTAGGRSLTIALEGTASNRDGVGARVTVEAGGSRRVAHRLGGGSFLSASDGRLHFGLGDATRADRVEVRWPSGQIDTFRDLAAGKGYRLREGEPRASPWPMPGGPR